MRAAHPTSKTKPNYSLEEIEFLVDHYEEYRALRRKLFWLVRFMDLDQALRNMPPKEYQAVLLVGLIGFDTRYAGQLLGTSHQTMWRRYRRGLEWLTDYLNGATHN